MKSLTIVYCAVAVTMCLCCSGGRGGYRGGRGGYLSASERYAAANASDDRSSHKCYNCNSFGHRAHECPKPKNQGECYECGARDHKSKDCPNVPPRQRSLFQTIPPDPNAVHSSS